MALFNRPRYTVIDNTIPLKDNERKKVKINVGDFKKCGMCFKNIHKDILVKNFNVCPSCSYHEKMIAKDRIEMLVDSNSFKEIDSEMLSVDILSFKNKTISYMEKYNKNRINTNMNDAIICGLAKLNKITIALGIMDFRFLGGSMGSVVGEKITRLIEKAIVKKIPLIIVTASGGARMYEGIFSLMQMAKTSGAINLYNKLNLPYIVVMTNPTTAGVVASFASLGDIIIAEPRALIGFAGPRVIRNTTRKVLPPGFQRSEFLLKKGFIDMIVDRRDIKKRLFMLLTYFSDVKIPKKIILNNK